MKFKKKSLGQNFLTESNIVKKIINLINLKDKNILEIGPGEGALTDEILKKKPKRLLIVEKDQYLSNHLKKRYKDIQNVKVINDDILNFDFKKNLNRKFILIGNLPYNISSQILVKVIKFVNINENVNDIIFMFQKELGEKIIAKFPSKHYGRISIITNLKLRLIKKFLVSRNCFFPKPKVTSMVLHLKSYKNKKYFIKDLSNLEKITNVLFSNRRKMINKSIKKILSEKSLLKIPDLKLNLRAENIEPNMYYKITEIYEKN